MSTKQKQKKTQKPIKQPIWPFLVPFGIALAYGLTILQIDIYPKINRAVAIPYSLFFIAAIIAFWVLLFRKRKQMNSSGFIGGVVCGAAFTAEIFVICVIILIAAIH
jgi:uncharacterized membrane protein